MRNINIVKGQKNLQCVQNESSVNVQGEPTFAERSSSVTKIDGRTEEIKMLNYCRRHHVTSHDDA